MGWGSGFGYMVQDFRFGAGPGHEVVSLRHELLRSGYKFWACDSSFCGRGTRLRACDTGPRVAPSGLRVAQLGPRVAPSVCAPSPARDARRATDRPCRSCRTIHKRCTHTRHKHSFLKREFLCRWCAATGSTRLGSARLLWSCLRNLRFTEIHSSASGITTVRIRGSSRSRRRYSTRARFHFPPRTCAPAVPPLASHRSNLTSPTLNPRP